MSLLKQLVLSFCIFALLPLIIFGAVDYSHSVRYLKAAALNELHSINAIQAERLYGQLDQHRDRIHLLANNPELKSYLHDYAKLGEIDPAKVGVSLENAITAISGVNKVSVFDADGTLVARVRAAGLATEEGSAQIDTRPPATELHFDSERAEIHMSQDIVHLGEGVGSLRVTTDARYFTRIFTSYQGFGDTGESMLVRVNNSGKAEALHPLRFANSARLSSISFGDLPSEATIARPDTFDYRGEAVMLSGRYIPELNWAVVVKKDIAEILQPANAILARLNTAILIIAMLAVFFAYKVANRIYAPIRSLAALAKSIQLGDLSQRANSQDVGEIGTLARAMDAMVDRLTQDNAQLEKVVEQRTAEANTARLRAEEKTRMQAEFLANMSHEIRTPMNGILGVANLLKDSPLTPQQREYIDILEHSGSSLLVIINDILDLSKLRSGKLELSECNFDLHRELELLIREFRASADQKKLALKLDIVAETPRWVTGDPVRLKQILVNLINNALKFTPQGSVSLRLEARHDMLEFTVSDTGIGIAKQHLDTIFEAFSQVDGSLTRKAGGTGLGLSIVHQLVLQMQGQILCDSTPNQGSTFTVRLPLKLANSEQHIVHHQHSTQSRSIPQPPLQQPLSLLIAEDNAVNQRIIHDLLSARGHQLTIVDNGAEAVREYRSHRFDKIVMDVQMPVMDGLQACRKIRELEGENGHHIPIIALTAHAMTDDSERCLAAGMSQYLSKPIDPQSLISQVEGRDCETIGAATPSTKPEDTATKDMVKMILDEARVKDITHNKPALIATIAQLFLSELPDMLADIDSAHASGDRQRLSSSVHRIKSALGNFSSKGFYEEVAILEQSAKDSPLDEWMQQWQQARLKLDQLGEELKTLAGI